MQRHPGVSRVVEPSAVHHQHIRVVRQLPDHLLQHLSFPEVQESCCVGDTCMAMHNPCGSDSAIPDYDRGCCCSVTFISGSQMATRENNETTSCEESVTFPRTPNWRA
jgi:hypothetical protein